MCTIRGKKYRTLISKICSYGETPDEENSEQISEDFREASSFIIQGRSIAHGGIDDIYANMTLEAIKKAYFSSAISCHYVSFIENYIHSCIQSFPDKIQELRPLLDFINENMRSEDFKRLDFYRKELEKLIYNRVEGFQFVCTTNELREIMFDFLKQYSDWVVNNINWTTGVYDKESGIFLTQIYYLSDFIARCGINYHRYIVITDSGNIFNVTNNDEHEKRRYDFQIPKQYEMLTDKVKEGIDFYENNDYRYRESLSEDMRKQLESIADTMDDRFHRKHPEHKITEPVTGHKKGRYRFWHRKS